MTSQDNQQSITVELFNSKIENILTQIQLGNEKLRNELREEIRALDVNIKVNTAKIEMLQHTFYWGVGIMAIVVALIPYFRREHSEKKHTSTIITEERVQELIDKAIGKAMTNIQGK